MPAAHPHPLKPWPRLAASAVACCLVALVSPALAEKADRSQPLTLESDQPCIVNLQKQTSVCSGKVVVSQGSLQLRAERLELRETPGGHQVMQANGSQAVPARFRQKRDGVDEYVEGQATRIDYDSRTGVLRFDGQAVVRRLRGTAVADEIQGALIIWDSQAEQFNVQGGARTASNPTGRVRAVITPRVDANEAAAPAPAASSPGPALRPSGTLGERR